MTGSITATGLTRRFGELTAVDSVDLSIAPGTLYGFLGRNGAGKTTLIRMLLGLIRPTSGEVSILGRAVDSTVGAAGPWADVGYLVDGPGLYPDLTARDHLHMARGLPPGPTFGLRRDRGEVGPGQVPRRQGPGAESGQRPATGPGHRAAASPAGPDPRRTHERDGPCGRGRDPRPFCVGSPTPGRRCSCPRTSSRRSSGWPTRSASSTRGVILDRLSRSRLTALGQPRLVVTLATLDSARRAVAALSAMGDRSDHQRHGGVDV